VNNDSIGETNDPIHEVDIEITPVEDSAGSGKAAAGVAAVLLAVMVAAILLITSTGGTDEVDVAADDDAAGDVEDAPEVPTTTQAPPDVEPSATQTTATDAAYGYGGFWGPRNNTVFADGQFIGLAYGPDGSLVRTSADGIEWNNISIDGLGQNAEGIMIDEHDGTVAALFQVWPEYDEESDLPFGPTQSPEMMLAVSTDLENWTITTLDLPQTDGREIGASSMALGDSGVVIAAESYPTGPDEMRILFEAGVISEENFENYCGLNHRDGAIDVQICDYSAIEEPDPEVYEELERAWEEAETDEERTAIEAQFEALHGQETEILTTITPGDPLYDQLVGIYDFEGEEMQPRAIVLAGPIEGPLAVATMPGSRDFGSLVEVGGSFVMASIDHANANPNTTMHSSKDGLVWAEVGRLSAHGQLVNIEDSLVFMGSSFDGPDAGTGIAALVSNDGGATWTDGNLETDIYAAYPMVASGPAGAVAMIQGYAEPMSGYDGPENPQVIERDGFTLTMDYSEGFSITLTGPDGEVIHSLTEEDMAASDETGDLEGVFRVNPLTDTPTFLDPETGEELVTFTQEDFESQYEAEEEMYEEPDQINMVVFSADGATWIELDDPRLRPAADGGSHLSLVAVGDDEAIFQRETWQEPPVELYAFEEEGREPTDEEIAAMEAWERDADGGNSTEFPDWARLRVPATSAARASSLSRSPSLSTRRPCVRIVGWPAWVRPSLRADSASFLRTW